MAKAMDLARGSTTPQRTLDEGDNSTGLDYNNTSCSTAGSVDNTSNDKAWYFYADTTADYQTMQTEYMYWSVSSKFGMHDSTAGLTKLPLSGVQIPKQNCLLRMLRCII